MGVINNILILTIVNVYTYYNLYLLKDHHENKWFYLKYVIWKPTPVGTSDSKINKIWFFF